MASASKFAVGDVIRHQRYGYRGVIVGFDESCQADDGWYHSNQTQPARDQPWYHVLVDGADHMTYVAESNLLPDGSDEPVVHPLLGRFFGGRFQGRYVTENPN